jgi:hypothetical protein
MASTNVQPTSLPGSARRLPRDAAPPVCRTTSRGAPLDGTVFDRSVVNAYWGALYLEQPKLAPGKSWLRSIDTAIGASNDIVSWKRIPPVAGATYRVQAHSVVLQGTEGGES